MKLNRTFSLLILLCTSAILLVQCKKDTISTPPPVVNKTPIANAGADKIITLPTNRVTLDGSACSDLDGKIVSYMWKKVAGPSTCTILNANRDTTTVNELVEGKYSFLLTITDDKNASNSDTINVIVNAAGTNQPPIANAGADKIITFPTNATTLDGSASSDPDGSIVKYEWTKVTMPTGEASIIGDNKVVSPTITGLTVPGTYTFQLTVTDNKGISNSDMVSIIVKASATQPPIARAYSIHINENKARMDGTIATDYDNTKVGLTYNWKFISGPIVPTMINVTTDTPRISGLTVDGDYHFKFIVTNSNLISDSTDVFVDVKSANGIWKGATADSTIIMKFILDDINPARVKADVSINGTNWTNLPLDYKIRGNLISGTFTVTEPGKTYIYSFDSRLLSFYYNELRIEFLYTAGVNYVEAKSLILLRQ